MSEQFFHVPMGIIKQIIVRIGGIVNAERPNETEPFEDLDIVLSGPNGEVLGRIEGRITVVRTILSPNVFGARVRIERHFFQNAQGQGFVDYVLNLMQVDENAPLGPASIHVNWIDLPEGSSAPNLFVADVEAQMLAEW